MSIAGFPSLGTPLNLADPDYLEHVSSIFLLYLKFCELNWLLCLGPLRFFNSPLYWSPGTIQSLFSLDQVKRFILVYGSIPGQKNNVLFSSLYHPPYSGESILSPDPSNFSDRLTTNMVDVSHSGPMLLIIAPSGAKSSIRVNSCFSSSENKPWTDWLPLGDNNSSKYLSIWPWYWNSPSVRCGSFNYLLIKSFQHRSVQNSLTTQFPYK